MSRLRSEVLLSATQISSQETWLGTRVESLKNSWRPGCWNPNAKLVDDSLEKQSSEQDEAQCACHKER